MLPGTEPPEATRTTGAVADGAGRHGLSTSQRGGGIVPEPEGQDSLFEVGVTAKPSSRVPEPWKVVAVHFASREDREAFAKLVGQTVTYAPGGSIWFPPLKGYNADEPQ